jgi:hypothetical protein
MQDIINKIRETNEKTIEAASRYLDLIQEISEKCKLTQQIGSHNDSAVDLATMINHTIQTKLGG